VNIFAELILANHHDILALIKILSLLKKISNTVLTTKRRLKTFNIEISLSVIGKVLVVDFISSAISRVVNHLLELALISLAASVLRVEYLKEIFFDGSHSLFLFKIFVNISDLEIVFEVIPFLVGLIIVCKDELFNLEFIMHVLEILIESIYEEIVVTALD